MYILKNETTKIEFHPILFLVDQILYRAIEVRASDIHLEPRKTKHGIILRLRYRIDGILYDQNPILEEQSSPVLSRLKVLSSLDIAQQSLPQDGKVSIHFVPEKENPRDIDLRISTFPSIHGEKMVIRILDRKGGLSLESLGCSDQVLQKISDLILHPRGLFLVTGPTGSGKTTTLYAILSKLNNSERNIVTMEDPVEYHIEGITQSQVNPKAGFTFETGLRSLLRQDPDVAMIGEIRDKQTAQIAIEMALTGHLVLSTLHTNDSFGAIGRLIDMGIEPFLVTACLKGVIAQRLVRKLCSYCRYKTGYFWKADGCDKCDGLGHKGRVGIFEFFTVDDAVRRLIVSGANEEELREYATRQGMKLLRDDAMEKVEDGIAL